MRMHALCTAFVALFVAVQPGPVGAGEPAWTPRAYADEDTVELGIVRPDGAQHWFKVWVVVIDDQAYVRLGSRSAAKIAENQTTPYLGVRVAGREFEHVKGEPAPDYADRVNAAMAGKYWSDFAVRLVAHPLTLRLRPDERPGTPG